MSVHPIPLPPEGQTFSVVLDTNVVMAFWHFRDPKLLALRGWLQGRGATLLTRSECLIELERVLAYRQFGIAPEAQVEVLAAVKAASLCLPDPTEEQMAAATALPRCKDKDDQKFLQLAWEGGAHFLITRDKMLLALNRRPIYRETLHIVTPERLMKTLIEAEQAA
ncbi:MAG: putative toxin-antitoxin system toxin component, PIN family [Rhodocyclaceae bacterium]